MAAAGLSFSKPSSHLDIWLSGLGYDCDEYLFIFQYYKAEKEIVYPLAPSIPLDKIEPFAVIEKIYRTEAQWSMKLPYKEPIDRFFKLMESAGYV